MINEKVTKALNGHLNRELYSAYLYLSMSAYCNTLGLKGFTHWFMAQYHEEMVHAMKFYEYLQKQGKPVLLSQIDTPENIWDSTLAVFEAALSHEQKVTGWINDLMDLAITEKDHATQIFLQWFVAEQVEEEETATDIIAQLKLNNHDPQGIFMLDKDLGTRVVTVPTDFTTGVEAAMKGGN